MKFRWESGLMYIDESGHFPPRDNRVPILASLLVPDNPADRGRLAEVARIIRLEALKHDDSEGRAKPHFMPDIALDHVAAVIREHWFVGHYGISPEERRRETMQRGFRKILRDFEAMRKRLPDQADRLDIRLDWLLRQLSEAIEGNVEYLALLVRAYQGAAKWFREHGIRPRIRAYLDDKLPPTDVQLLAFLIRFSFCLEFPEFYRDMGMILGLRPCAEFDAQVATDDDVDGLAVVSAIAWVRGMIASDRDQDGKCKRLLGLMTREK